MKRIVKTALRRFGIDAHRIRPIVEERARLLDFVAHEVKAIEDSIDYLTKRGDVIRRLRSLSLSDFGMLMFSLPNPDYPKISALLPRMANKEIQISWTGSCGLTLLVQTIDFARSLSLCFTRITGRCLEEARILDFGCGYGRILRLIYFFTDEDQVFAVDPWDKSIEVCHAGGLKRNIALSDYLPTTLPVGSAKFDLIYAFSVFTHLSERATMTCLTTIANYLNEGGVIAITIRPVEYWEIDVNAAKKGAAERQQEIHMQRGFSFLAHQRPPIDGEITYGDTSMSLEWLERAFPRLKIVDVDRSLSDPYQLCVYLQKR